MTIAPDRQSPESPSSIRTGARLDAATRQQVDDLARRFHQPRAAVLCSIMHWGLSRGATGPLDEGDARGPVHHLSLSVASDLAQTQQACHQGQ